MPDIASARPVSGEAIATAWGDEVHDQLEGIQAGVANVVAPGSTPAPSVTITFPRPYATPPVVLAVALTGGGAQVAYVQTPSATAVVVGVSNQTGTGNVVAATIGVQWIAIGKPA